MRAIKNVNAENNAARIPLHKTDQPRYITSRPAGEFRKIALPTMEGIDFEKIHDIIYLEAKGNYTVIYFKDGRKALVCKTLREMETTLADELQFVRIHRSFTINLNCLKKYVKGKAGYVIMENGQNINISLGKKQDFINRLQYYFA